MTARAPAMSPWSSRARTSTRLSGCRWMSSIARRHGSFGPTERAQQFLPTELDRLVIERREDAVDETDAMFGAMARDNAYTLIGFERWGR